MAKNRYIVLLDNQNEKSIRDVEKGFSVSVTSSEYLSKENRSFNIIDNNHAVLYKNLGVVVVDDVDEEQLTRSIADSRSPVIYFEKEKEFFPANEISLINDLKTNVDQLKNKISELENYIRNKPIPKPAVTELEWGLKAIGIGETQFSGKGIDVCILDTGFDVSHPDFTDRVIDGKSFIEDEEWNKDPNGHGTHCAGIACGNVRNDTGKRYGIAKDSNLKIGKVLANNGKGTTSSIIDAIDWAITKKYRIISLSLASPVKLNEKPSALFETVGNRALDSNCLIIAAAGNESKRPALPLPVSGNINVCAPGVDVLSSYPKKSANSGNYLLLSGTSMATPHVSGLAALYMEQFPDLNAREIWELLESRAKPIENLKYRDIGKGLIQVIQR